MKVDLKGKVALVTGAAQGIGLAIADTLARNEAEVVYTDRNVDGAATAAKQSGAKLSFGLDVTSSDQIEAGVDRVLKTFGHLDIVVNNAGMGVPPGDRTTIDQFKPESWDRLLKVDLTGVFLMSRAGARPMIRQKSGRIINIASVLGLVPMRLQSSYVAAKAGVVNLTRSMAIELAPHGILVNGIAPGSTATEDWKKWIHDKGSEAQDLHMRLMSHIPLGRPASTQEIANGALFLAAPESSYVTGHILTVDGGWTAGFARDF
jgi:NAD(P)-dependent dehydrogenase (short-subunit alcohol dehydrogenase family)